MLHLCHYTDVDSRLLPSVLWRCWLGGRKGIRPVKIMSGGVLAWLSVWSEMQTCKWPSWYHCHSLSLASVKSRLVLPFCFWLTRVVPEKGPLNVCVYCCRHKSEKYESCSVPMERGAGGCGSGRRARLPDTDFCVLLCFSGEEVGVSDHALYFFRWDLPVSSSPSVSNVAVSSACWSFERGAQYESNKQSTN